MDAAEAEHLRKLMVREKATSQAMHDELQSQSSSRATRRPIRLAFLAKALK